MRKAFTAILAAALALSWLWFWTVSTRPSTTGTTSSLNQSDTITVWVNDLLGSPDEAHYYALADLWNTIEPGVHVKMSVMSHGGYESKLRVAIASGQPPDVCFSGLETLENLQYSGKSADLAVPIPDRYLPAARLNEMGDAARRSIMRDGHPTVFPIWRYVYGGFILANNTMLKQAGVDDEQIRQHGWTFAEFRAAAKAMTRDVDGDGKPDTWGFGAALVHLPHLFLNEFGPGVWGKEVTEKGFLDYDAKAGHWTIHPSLTEAQIEQVFDLFDQLINVDKSWNPAYLGMTFAEIIDDVTLRQKLGMTFGETPWTPRMRADIWAANQALGAHQPPLAELTDIWMPTARARDRPVPRAGAMGFSVFKQSPYKGDVHTENAMRVAAFITNPVHLARSQLRQFRHLPPASREFGEIFPELLHADDPWVKFYNDVMNSGVPMVPFAPPAGSPQAPGYGPLRVKVDQWLARQGNDYLQQVVYRRRTPHEAAVRFFDDLHALAR
jgi:ABC-type glycerol-3-phosphate transport system substrate-binding protein